MTETVPRGKLVDAPARPGTRRPIMTTDTVDTCIWWHIIVRLSASPFLVLPLPRLSLRCEGDRHNMHYPSRFHTGYVGYAEDQLYVVAFLFRLPSDPP